MGYIISMENSYGELKYTYEELIMHLFERYGFWKNSDEKDRVSTFPNIRDHENKEYYDEDQVFMKIIQLYFQSRHISDTPSVNLILRILEGLHNQKNIIIYDPLVEDVLNRRNFRGMTPYEYVT